jgi:hypothetical protein
MTEVILKNQRTREQKKVYKTESFQQNDRKDKNAIMADRNESHNSLEKKASGQMEHHYSTLYERQT